MAKSDTYTTIIPFIREEGLKGITTLALVRFMTKREMSHEAIIKAFTKCLTWWVKNNPEGRKAWQDSCGDFNVGDLALYGSKIQEGLYHSKLTAQGILDYEVLTCGSTDGVIEFDRMLIDRKQLPDDWDKE